MARLGVGRGALAFLAACAALRIAIPLIVLARRGHKLPLVPEYHYDPRPGDAYGYYSATRSLLATWRQPGTLAILGLLLAVALVAAVQLRRRRQGGWAVVAVAAGAGAGGAVLAARMASAGAPTIGWPLVWSVPLLPYRALGLPLDPGIAFGVGLALSLLANVVTLVATAVLGRLVTGRAAVGLIAAGVWSVWPLLTGTIAGHEAWQNGTWLVDVGLHVYSEPVSTALVIVALALFAQRAPGDVQLALAGALLSAATVVRLSNAVIAAVVLAVGALRLPVRRTVLLAASLLTMAPVELAYWSKGYTHLPGAGGGLPSHPFALHYVRSAWTGSYLWYPRVLVLLVPLAVIGTVAVAPAWRRWLLWLAVAATAAFYSVYAVTDIHPRFLYVVFPVVLVLWSAGLTAVVGLARARLA
jgi:hypothetical protein